MRFDKQFIIQALSDVSILYGNFPEEPPRFSIDTRTLQSGDIFIALPGVQTDGHEYINQALLKGAQGIILAKSNETCLNAYSKTELQKKLILSVDDTQKALFSLACAWRAQFDYPVIAITGSVGKTSTKEMLANILDFNGMKYLASYGNQNTQIGVSLNILRMRDYHQAAIFEVGISKRGEMAKLAQLVQPTTAVITAIGHSHMEGLGSLSDIASEKRNVFKYFSEKSIGIINGDLPILSRVSYSHPMIKFGSKTTNQIQARKMTIVGSSVRFILKIYKQKFSIVLKQPHIGMVYNALAATAVAHLLNVPTDIIVKAIQSPPIIAGRFEQRSLKYNKGILINDSYNANPESMKAALLAFQQIETKAQKVAILGDMLELGVNSPFWHRQLGRFLRKVPSLQKVVLVGQLVEWTKKTAPANVVVEHVATWQDALKILKTELQDESVLLVKGSHSIGLESLVEKLAPAEIQT